MVMLREPTPWYHADLGSWFGRLRAEGQLAVAFLTLALCGAGLTLGVLIGVTVWQWIIANPEIAAIFGLSVALPLALLWIVVRVVRHAWHR